MLELNKNQEMAINHNNGPMMVLSGPGSGKTTVITHRIKNLIHSYDIHPSNILVITFTKAASIEMKNRFSNLSDRHREVSFLTFHSYFFKIIRNHYRYNIDNILQDYEKYAILKKIVLAENIPFESEEEFLQNISSEISLVKSELIPYHLFDSDYANSDDFHKIYKIYEEYKETINKIDFDDMLIKCYNLLRSNNDILNFWKNKYNYILIDEFQDINKVQYECIKLLTSDEKNIFIVGDDDQSIYGFRGSSPSFLLDFPSDFPNTKKVVLNINYRSSNEIISLCSSIISDNEHRYKKNIVGNGLSFKSPVLIRCKDAQEEAIKIAEKIKSFEKDYKLKEIAIIYRTNLQARAIVEIFMDYNIPYQTKDAIPSIYEHFICKDIISYLRLCLDNNSSKDFINIANKPKRYLNKSFIIDCCNECKGKKPIIEYISSSPMAKSWQLERLSDLLYNLSVLKTKSPYDAIKYILNTIGYSDYLDDYASFKKINPRGFFDVVDEILEASKGHSDIKDFLVFVENVSINLSKKEHKDTNFNGVVLTTMHSAKGLEFDIVFVISCIDGIIPHKKSKGDLNIEEERRLFYVALTRARKILLISILKTKYDNDVTPSRFLQKLIKPRR